MMRKTSGPGELSFGFGKLSAVAGIQPAAFALPALLAATGALFELLSGILLIPALEASILLRFDSLEDSAAVAFVKDLLFADSKLADKSLFLAVLIVIVAASLIKTALLHEASVIYSRLIHLATGNVRRKLFSRCLHADKRLFDQVNLGHLNNLLLGQLHRVSAQAVMAQDALSHFFLFAAYMSVMAWISLKLTLLVAALLPLLNGASNLMTRRLRASSHGSASAQAVLSARAAGSLANSALVRSEASYAREEMLLDRAASRADEVQADIDVKSGLMPRVQESVFILMMVALLFGLAVVETPGQASGVPSLLVFIYVARRASISAMAFSRLKGAAAAVEGALSEVESVFELAGRLQSHSGDMSFPGLQKGLSFALDSFAFPGGQVALAGIYVEVNKGKTLAVVGPSGSGKSTLLNLILRHYAPPPGAIRLDGVDIRDFTAESLAAKIAVVPQDPGFFDDTLRANLSYPSLEPVPEELLRKALREAGLLEIADGRPPGLDGRIGEEGIRLSGGERQRLAIARALLKGGDILLFDEATSALDSETEAVVRRSLENATEGRTSIIVAHRLSTIRHADTILVLEGGRAVQTGTFEELRDAPGPFRRLLEAQSFR